MSLGDKMRKLVTSGLSVWFSAATLAVALHSNVALAAPGNGNAPLVGTLSTTFGSSIPAPDLATWIGQYAGGQQLVTLSECFGGNALSAFAGMNNTAVMSATSPGQAAIYGGFDTAAAGALKPYTPPANATSGLTVYNAGVAGKNPAETPTTGGGLGLGSFSMESTSTDDGAINSRNVLFYAGVPDTGNGTNGDAVQFGTIKNNFNGQESTTVTAVGGDPVNPATPAFPWTLPGSAAGLQEGVQSTGGGLGMTQSIYFIGDHGGLRNVAAGLNRSSGANATPSNVVAVPAATLLPPADPNAPAAGEATPTSVTDNFATFTDTQLPVNLVNANRTASGGNTGTQDNMPCFSILIPVNNNVAGKVTPDATNKANGISLGMDGTGATNLVTNGGDPAWVLYLTNTNAAAIPQVITLTSSFETVYDPTAGNANLNDFNVDSGIRVCFQVTDQTNPNNPLPQPGTPGFDNIFFNQTYNATLLNYTGMDWDVAEFAQDNPSVANQIPEPSTIALGCTTMIFMLGRRRRTRVAAPLGNASR